jgi:hypothetical protein
MIQFCVRNNLCIANTFFKDANGGTYHRVKSKDVYEVTLDYALVDTAWFSEVKECVVNVKGGAEPYTDHRMVQMDIRYKNSLSQLHSADNYSQHQHNARGIRNVLLNHPQQPNTLKRARKRDFSLIGSDRVLASKLTSGIDKEIELLCAEKQHNRVEVVVGGDGSVEVTQEEIIWHELYEASRDIITKVCNEVLPGTGRQKDKDWFQANKGYLRKIIATKNRA